MIKHDMLNEAKIVYIGDRLWELAKVNITDYNLDALSQILPKMEKPEDIKSGNEILNDIKDKIRERRKLRGQ